MINISSNQSKLEANRKRFAFLFARISAKKLSLDLKILLNSIYKFNLQFYQ
jgi:hypothetical protein